MMLQAVADILRRRQTEGWLVGGSVRDHELGRYSPDLDVVVADDAVAVVREVAATLRAPWFVLSERHPAYRVMGPEGHVDVAPVKGSGILDDLAERDFTVNAMAIPVGQLAARPEGLVDPFGGLAHLRQRRLVAVSEHIFTDDPLRLMRAARFCHVLGLRLDEPLVRLVKTQAPQLGAAAAERVTAEMILTLAGGRATDAVRIWDDLRLLAEVLPEVVAAEQLGPTIALLTRLDDLLDRPSAWFPATVALLAGRLAQPVDGGLSRPVALRLAGLMHGLRAEEAEAVGRRLKLSGEMVSLLRTASRRLSREHALPSAPLGRAAVLFLWGVAPWEPEVILLEAASDGKDSDAGESNGVGPVLGRARGMMALWAERADHGVPRLPLDGEVLMRELGLGSGPILGRALREARLAWEAGEATSFEVLLAVARDAVDR
jgi:tRNA nucleotidyltransferase/poly(A) polymerase